MKIAIACDHGGYDMKENLAAYLREQGHEVKDFGSYSSESIDYPDFIFPAAEAVASGEFERGVVVCTTGIGVSICANKVKGIRCALCSDEYSARMTREHNDTNMIAFGGNVTTVVRAREMLEIWLKTPFSNGERHCRRIGKISTYEQTH
ncbi:MAG TPA: ribose 5-phosphate isomerase B [Eubacteriales bacterium]|mgnify:FL=1|nr:ribose 5-phosphate isomerase B [Eubacteriales bacterium]